jgi:uncharacterized protein (DUF433 family)
VKALVFTVTEEANGSFVAQAIGGSIITQADTLKGLRANVREAVKAFPFDGPVPTSVRLQLDPTIASKASRERDQEVDRTKKTSKLSAHRPHVPKSLITVRPGILGGTTVFTGTRVPVRTLFDYLRANKSVDKFVFDFPTVKRARVTALLQGISDSLAGAPFQENLPISKRA